MKTTLLVLTRVTNVSVYDMASFVSKKHYIFLHSFTIFTQSCRPKAAANETKVKVKVVNLYIASSCTTYTSNALFVTNQSRRSHSRCVQPANTLCYATNQCQTM